MSSLIQQRKDDHLRLCGSYQVNFKEQTTLLEDIHLVHQALPEIAFDQISLEIPLLGHVLRAPLLITGMSGGTQTAQEMNLVLASVAQQLGIGFGLGSQRAMLENPALTNTYRVRSVAPDVLLLGNIGLVQLKQFKMSQIAEMTRQMELDALCVHLNPAQELMQHAGDRDFSCGLDTLAHALEQIPVPIIVKETGCGLSLQVGQKLKSIGIEFVDTSGAGGTSFVTVESLRQDNQDYQETATLLREWGIPTAASIVYMKHCGFYVCASGGIRHGLDVAKAIALGARWVGMAAPVLRAYQQGGESCVLHCLTQIIHSLKTITLLCGQKHVADLSRTPMVIGERLRLWATSQGLLL